MARSSKAKTSPKRRAYRRDGYVNQASGHGTSRDRRTQTSYRTDIVREYEAMGLWRSDWVIKRIIELKPKDAMRPGFTISVGGDDGEGKEIAKDLTDECERLCIAEKITEAGQYRNAYGGCALFPVLEGTVGELWEPLEDYEDGIERIAALHLLEPRELVPNTWYTDIRNPKFRRPETYRLVPLSSGGSAFSGMEIIHESRLAIFRGFSVSNQVQPGQRVGWDDSIIAHVRQAAADLGLAWGSVSMLLQNFARGVVKLDKLADILKEKDGEAILARRLNAMDMTWSSIRATLLDKNDEYIATTTPVGGLEGLMVQLAQYVAAAAGITVTKLLGISPAGMNATGEGDARSWYDECSAELKLYLAPLHWLIRLITLQTDGPCDGVEPESWSTEWNPPWQQPAKEIAETRLADAQRAQIMFNTGAASGDDIARAMCGEKYSGDIHVDWDERAKQEAQMTTDPGTTELPPGSRVALKLGVVPPVASGTVPKPIAPKPAEAAS